MQLQFFLLTHSETRLTVVLFILCGLVAYWADYRSFKNEDDLAREALLVKITALSFIIGGFATLLLYQLLVWFS